jgi:CRISPR type I-D-associated protein Csc2
MNSLLSDIQVLSRGLYLQIVFTVKLLDNTIIRSNEPEEVLTYTYDSIGNRFIIPWRKFKGKLRRLVLEKQRSYNISKDCSLKDDLCMQCPTCLLFGGTGETSTAKVPYNFLSRVLGETLISKTEVAEISTYTANAVDEKTLTTGQALMNIVTVPAETEFVGVLTLHDPTPALSAILVDNLGRFKRLGASTREWGRCDIEINGYKLSDREDLSAYHLIGKEKNDWGLDNDGNLSLPEDIEECYQKVKEDVEKLVGPLLKNKKK